MKIAFIHHGSVTGGAPTSLRNMVLGLSKIYPENEYTIYCVYKEMVPFFQGIENIKVKEYIKIPLYSGRVLIGHSSPHKMYHWKLFLEEIINRKTYIKDEEVFLRKEKPDILHLNSAIIWTSIVAAKRLKIPVVQHLREANYKKIPGRFLRRYYYNFISKHVEKIVCIGPREYKNAGKTKKKLIIYNSLDNTFFNNNNETKIIRNILGISLKKYCFLSLGGNSFLKGTFQLIECTNYIDDDFLLLLAGERPIILNESISLKIRILLKCEELMLKLGIIKTLVKFYPQRLSIAIDKTKLSKINILGILYNVKPYINACDVLVFAGTTPHSARPVYEAWALKKPVIVFDSEVMRLDIEDGVDGIIVNKHTPKALAEALIYLRNNPEKAKKMGENGYRKAIDRFSLEKNTKKIFKIYKEIINEDCL